MRPRRIPAASARHRDTQTFAEERPVTSREDTPNTAQVAAARQSACSPASVGVRASGIAGDPTTGAPAGIPAFLLRQSFRLRSSFGRQVVEQAGGYARPTAIPPGSSRSNRSSLRPARMTSGAPHAARQPQRARRSSMPCPRRKVAQGCRGSAAIPRSW